MSLTTYRHTGPSAKTVELIRQRDDWSCVKCGTGDWLQTHHRRPRGLGGTSRKDANQPQSLLTLCRSCHAAVETERFSAYTDGHLVSIHADPLKVPCLVARGSAWKYLTRDGRYADDPPGGGE